MEDTDIKVKVRLHSDNNAARQFPKRQSLGKMRHIMTRHLWLHDRIRLGHLQLMPVLGTERPADMMTKALTKAEIEKYLTTVGVFARG